MHTTMTNMIYIVTHNPMPGRFESETPMDEVIHDDSLTKVFTDFALAKKYHEDLCVELGAEEDEDVSERIYFIPKQLTQ